MDRFRLMDLPLDRPLTELEEDFFLVFLLVLVRKFLEKLSVLLRVLNPETRERPLRTLLLVAEVAALMPEN